MSCSVPASPRLTYARLARGTVCILAAAALELPARAPASCINYPDYFRVLGNNYEAEITTGVRVKNGLAYIGGAYQATGPDSQGVWVVDVSNPTNPQVVGSARGLAMFGVELAGSYLIGIDGQYGRNLYSFDVSDPTRPTLVSTLTFPSGLTRDAAISGDLLYVADWQRFAVVKVGVDGQLSLVGQTTVAGNGNGVAVQGSYAYVAAGLAGLHVIDIHDPENPQQIRTVSIPTAFDVAVSGNYAYVAEQGALRVVDVSDPANATVVGQLSVPNCAGRVVVDGNRAFVGNGWQLEVLDLSNPAAPVDVGRVSTEGSIWDIATDAGRAYIANGGHGATIIDVSTPHPSPQIARLTLNNSVAMDVSGNKACVAVGTAGVQVVDVTDPAAPIRRGLCHTPGYALDVAIAGNYAYVADEDADVQVVNLANPSLPTLAGSAAKVGYALEIAVQGQFAYVIDGFWVYDISNPASPTPIAYLENVYDSRVLEVSGAYAYVADGYDLRVINITNPYDPFTVSTMDFAPAGVTYIASQPPYVYVATFTHDLGAWNEDVRVVDMSNPVSPHVIKVLKLPISAYSLIGGLTVHDSQLYVTASQAGLFVYDVSTPTNPVFLGQASLNLPQQPIVRNEVLWVPDGTAVNVYALQCATPTDAAPPPETAGFRSPTRLTAWPNPARGALQLQYVTGEAGPATIDIFDVAGRRLRHLRASPAIVPGHAAWDGRDERGRLVPGGVYIVRLQSAAGTASTHATLVR